MTTGLTAGLAALVPVTAGHAAPVSRQQAYADAAARYGVPESVLLAVSFLESRWDAHAGQPSTAGGYGPMNLTDVANVSADALAAQPNEDARGDTQRPLASPDRPEYTGDQPSLRTLGTAADLTGTPERTLRTDAAANIAGGAALLARYQKDLGVSGSDPADWYGAVARYSGAPDEAGARTFADEVFDVLRSGESRRTDGGDTVSLAADPQVSPATGQLAALHLTKADASGTECPSDAGCDFIPAAYALNSADPGDYGNYDKADRPRDMKIQYLVIHDNEGYYNGTISWFQNPRAYAAANYELRSSDGHITQMIENKDLAWQAGNWYINMHSIGIEHEGFAATGATWYTEAMYRQSAKLVRYLAGRYGIPLDRQHIIGHDNVPGTLPTTIRNMHWDPGPFWDWDHYMDLVRGHADHGAGGPDSGLVTVKPGFASNQQVVTGCDKSGSGTPCAAQPTNFAYLRTAPSDDAPLVSDPKLHAGPGTTDIADVAARATDGQQFAVADRKPGWTAIWYLGQEAWLHSSQVRPAVGFVVTPKPGKDSVPVYGRAYPETSAYDGSPVPVQAVTPLGYLFASGQRYPLGLTDVPADYYYAPTIDLSMPGDHTVVRGHDRYFEIQFGHRVAYVRAADVTVRNANAAS
ncbi:N-acetylmuramoyl-L-alanine amidase [Actinocatenispora rupis]|uniref:N-acetylmuramoyl-L-alanine amidase n=1 Tax=Actinocatenispora rupis TaxID=519421 RepID=UPI001EF1863F|nr:N-acetylmuramoyl-L-alanine amidase [Actinocatenispora rupis]